MWMVFFLSYASNIKNDIVCLMLKLDQEQDCYKLSLNQLLQFDL
jgi:hypothetical protein